MAFTFSNTAAAIKNTARAAAITLVAATTVAGISSPASSQEVEVASANLNDCVTPKNVASDASGKQTGKNVVCVLKEAIAQEESQTRSLKNETAALKNETAALKNETAALKTEEQVANAESNCADNFMTTYKAGGFDKAKLRTFLGGKKPSEVGACKIWDARGSLLVATP